MKNVKNHPFSFILKVLNNLSANNIKNDAVQSHPCIQSNPSLR